MRNRVNFINNVIKQGNSLCVRIPHSVKKMLDLKEGTEVSIELTPRKYFHIYSETDINQLLKVAKKIKKLNKYSESKQRLFIFLNFQFLKETYSKNYVEEKKKQSKFIKDKKKEFGSKLIDEFIDWATIIKSEGFIEEKDSSLVLNSSSS